MYICTYMYVYECMQPRHIFFLRPPESLRPDGVRAAAWPKGCSCSVCLDQGLYCSLYAKSKKYIYHLLYTTFLSFFRSVSVYVDMHTCMFIYTQTCAYASMYTSGCMCTELIFRRTRRVYLFACFSNHSRHS